MENRREKSFSIYNGHQFDIYKLPQLTLKWTVIYLCSLPLLPSLSAPLSLYLFPSRSSISLCLYASRLLLSQFFSPSLCFTPFGTKVTHIFIRRNKIKTHFPLSLKASPHYLKSATFTFSDNNRFRMRVIICLALIEQSNRKCELCMKNFILP